MSFPNTELTKTCHHNYFMTLRIRKNDKIMSFSNI